MARFAVLLILGAAVMFVPADITAQDLPAPRRVLLLHEEVASRPFRARFNAAFIEALRSDQSSIDVYEEAIEPEQPLAGQLSLGREYLKNKYARQQMDVIVVVSSRALAFAKENRGMFGNPAIVAVVTPRGLLMEHDNITGLEGTLWIDATIGLALALRPDTKRVFVIDGIRNNTGDLQTVIEHDWSARHSNVDLVYLRDLQTSDLLSRVATIPEDSIVFFVRQTIRNSSQDLDPFEAVSQVTRVSRAPVFSPMEEFIGRGVVGGHMWDFDADARRIAVMARQLAHGASVRDVPPGQQTYRDVLDWRQLQRWHIAPSLLPREAEIRFRQPTAWELYRWYIVGALAIVALQALTIALLVAQRTRRRDAQARNVAILGAIPDMMFLIDRNGMYVDYFAHDARKRGLLLEPAQFLGRRMREVLPPATASLFEEAFARLAAGETPVVIEYRLPMPEGEHHYEARMVPCNGNQILAVVRDITDQKCSEQALLRTQADLARVSRLTALGEFAASIGHEVRQPLTAVVINAKASLRWLSGTTPDLVQVRAALADIIDAGQRADEVIIRNLELFRHHTVQKGPIDLNKVILEAAVLAQQRLEANRVVLVTSLADGLPPANGDHVELQQVLLNLISNAIDALEFVEPEMRRVSITTSIAGDGILKVAVSDTGIGFGGVDMQQMFTLSYTTKSRGSGVGLSISRAIVDAHGGELWAEQNSGAGATFFFTIPVRSTIAA